ncbi:helix-hairpin-helix domain-containing protein [Candidatus Thiothrix anitrata]|jgi:hypothetical protein|uniref:Helix-hairpin-helix domain-containing protein n=1 Tax=Candidatus Thiothrix anitrata TaxID=2823902 RepID=A0ABX7X6J8_9GAMM|nr:helix-hairpin-helix domain-containing protein [Candidatus Thiothrix anitrata]QTR49439.1 hypothetical protein J8380_14500 [Candidatus Thiothrix anitrata]
MEQNILDVKYVGQATATRLAEQGITTVAQLAATDVDALAAIPGIGATNAPLMLTSAQELLATPQADAEVSEVTELEVVAPIVADGEQVAEPVTDTVPEIETEIQQADGSAASNDAVVSESAGGEVSDKKAKKLAKQAKKAEKKAKKQAKKQAKEAKKAERKAAKKAAKKAKKAEKKAKKAAKE